MPEPKKGSGDPQDPKGNPPAIDPDNPKAEDIKNLQKSLSDKDVLLKQALSDIETFKKTKVDEEAEVKKKADEKKTAEELEREKMKEDLKTMSEALKVFNDGKRKDYLAKEYPDIEPDLLVGKTDEQVEKIVEKQRVRNKEIYGDSKFFIKPKYESEDDIQKEIDLVKKDTSLRGDQGAVKILHLMREKFTFKK